MLPEEMAALIGELSAIEMIVLLETIERELRARRMAHRRTDAGGDSVDYVHAAHLALAAEVYGLNIAAAVTVGRCRNNELPRGSHPAG